MVDDCDVPFPRRNSLTRCILGVSFFAGTLDEALEHARQGGLVLAPSGPGLANDLPRDPAYARALAAADLILPDSGLMILWWNRFRPAGSEKLSRLSGLLFLKELIRRESKGTMRSSFWIMPDAEQDASNRCWLAEKAGIDIDDADVYLAPLYNSSGPIIDDVLLERVQERDPKVIVVNLGGGVQERLGHYLRDNLSHKPAILCTGAAVAFLSGQQVRIPQWADRIYLGWFLRCLANPARFIPRYWAARKLVGLLRRYGSGSPCPKEMSGAGEPV